MRMNAPKSTVWLIATIIGVLGIVGKFVAIPVISANAFWLVAVGFIILCLSTVLKGL